MSEIFKNDIGTKILVNIGVDVSTATVLELHYKKPSGESGSWTASLEGGSNTSIFYIAVADDLDEIGTWQVQCYIEMPTWKGRGSLASFSVSPGL